VLFEGLEERRLIENRMKKKTIARAIEEIFKNVDQEADYRIFDRKLRAQTVKQKTASIEVEKMLMDLYQPGLAIVPNHEHRYRPDADAIPLCIHVESGKVSYLVSA